MNFLKAFLIIFFGLITFGIVAFFVYLGLDSYMDNNNEEIKNVFVQVENVAEKKVYADMAIEKALSVNPKEVSFQEWNKMMNDAIILLDDVEMESKKLDEMSAQMTKNAQKKISFTKFFPNVYAMNSQEVIAVFDAAPAGRRLRTLANHFGVDAKRARAMLKVAQGEITADSWNKAGDSFERLENTAKVIKDTSKVIVYVGGAAISGGATTTLGTFITQGGLIVGGADLLCEIGEDAANIALGYNNKASAFLGGMRKLNAPLATVFSVANLDGAFDAVMFGVDQINSALQENTYLGLTIDFDKAVAKIDGTDKPEEIKDWMSKRQINNKPDSVVEILTGKDIPVQDNEQQILIEQNTFVPSVSDEVVEKNDFDSDYDMDSEIGYNDDYVVDDIDDELMDITESQQNMISDSVAELSGNMAIQWGRAFGSLRMDKEDWNAKWKLSTLDGVELNFTDPYKGERGFSYRVVISDINEEILNEITYPSASIISLESGEYIIEIYPVSKDPAWECNW